MGFQEKNAWACGCAILIVFTPYFWFVFNHPMSYAPLFIISALGLVGTLVGFHIVNAIATDSIRKSGNAPKRDELDQAIELRATKIAGVLLAIAVSGWSITAMVAFTTTGVTNIFATNADAVITESSFTIPVPEVMRWIHILFAGFVISNVAYYGAIVFGYRRLAHG